MTWSQFLPIEPCAKARPRVTRRGTYMPKAYMKWREKFCALVAAPLIPFAGRLEIRVMVYTKSGKMRPDLDNVGGACLDALQDAKVIGNDRDAVHLRFAIEKNKKAGIVLIVDHHTDLPT